MSDKQISVTVDIEKMTIGDLELMEKATGNELSATEMVSFLDRIVEEDVRAMPITALNDIIVALNKAIAASAEPETPEGN